MRIGFVKTAVANALLALGGRRAGAVCLWDFPPQSGVELVGGRLARRNPETARGHGMAGRNPRRGLA